MRAEAFVLDDTDPIVVCLVGDMDFAMRDDVTSLLERLSDSGGPVIVDMEHVSFMDSSILSVLIRAAQTMTIRLRNVSQRVEQLFEITGTSSQFEREPER